MEEAIPKPSEKRVALVTGGNRGMGFEICRQLASSGLAVVLTARDEKRGAEAVDRLRGLGLPDVVFHQLEITEPASAARLADFVRNKFGKLDVLVNNAGTMGVTMEVGEAAVKEIMFGCIKTEFRQGPERDCRMAEAADHAEHSAGRGVPENQLPRHQKGHRGAAPTRPILRRWKDHQCHVSVWAAQGMCPDTTSQIMTLGREIYNLRKNPISMHPALSLVQFFSGEELRRELSGSDTLTKRRLDELSALFVEDLKRGELGRRGWPADRVYAAYQASKALVCAYTRILARENAGLRVNCVHPGYVETEMNCNTGNLTAAEGASVSVAVALAERGGVTGAYFDRTEMASFV